MKSEAFHFAKSFEHGPKASKQLNYIVFNDLIDISMSKIIIFQTTNIENQFWHMILCVKITLISMVMSILLETVQNDDCLKIFIFMIFHICYLFVFLRRRGRAEPFKLWSRPARPRPTHPSRTIRSHPSRPSSANRAASGAVAMFCVP